MLRPPSAPALACKPDIQDQCGSYGEQSTNVGNTNSAFSSSSASAIGDPGSVAGKGDAIDHAIEVMQTDPGEVEKPEDASQFETSTKDEPIRFASPTSFLLGQQKFQETASSDSGNSLTTHMNSALYRPTKYKNPSALYGSLYVEQDPKPADASTQKRRVIHLTPSQDSADGLETPRESYRDQEPKDDHGTRIMDMLYHMIDVYPDADNQITQSMCRAALVHVKAFYGIDTYASGYDVQQNIASYFGVKENQVLWEWQDDHDRWPLVLITLDCESQARHLKAIHNRQPQHTIPHGDEELETHDLVIEILAGTEE